MVAFQVRRMGSSHSWKGSFDIAATGPAGDQENDEVEMLFNKSIKKLETRKGRILREGPCFGARLLSSPGTDALPEKGGTSRPQV